jgi:hypothetical protein
MQKKVKVFFDLDHRYSKIYFVSEDKPKTGDWCMDTLTNSLFKMGPHADVAVRFGQGHIGKIVAASEPSLWYTNELTPKGIYEMGVLDNAGRPYPKYAWDCAWYKPTNIARIPQDFLTTYKKEKGMIKEVMLEMTENGQYVLINPMDRECSPEEWKGTGTYKLKLRPDGTVYVSPVCLPPLTQDEFKYLKEVIEAGDVSIWARIYFRDNRNRLIEKLRRAMS